MIALYRDLVCKTKYMFIGVKRVIQDYFIASTPGHAVIIDDVVSKLHASPGARSVS